MLARPHSQTLSSLWKPVENRSVKLSCIESDFYRQKIIRENAKIIED